MLVLSLIVIASLGFYQFAVAKPYAKPTLPSADLQKVLSAKDRANDRAEKAIGKIQDKTWKTTEDELESTSLEALTKIAETNHLELSDFRTDKHTDVLDLHETPFVAVVEGSFPDVLSFVQTLESPDKQQDVNLAVNMLQIASSDSGAGRVTATVGLVGFMYKEAG